MKLLNILSNIGLFLLLAIAVFLVFSLAAISNGGYDDPNRGTTGLVMQDTDHLELLEIHAVDCQRGLSTNDG